MATFLMRFDIATFDVKVAKFCLEQRRSPDLSDFAKLRDKKRESIFQWVQPNMSADVSSTLHELSFSFPPGIGARYARNAGRASRLQPHLKPTHTAYSMMQDLRLRILSCKIADQSYTLTCSQDDAKIGSMVLTSASYQQALSVYLLLHNDTETHEQHLFFLLLASPALVLLTTRLDCQHITCLLRNQPHQLRKALFIVSKHLAALCSRMTKVLRSLHSNLSPEQHTSCARLEQLHSSRHGSDLIIPIKAMEEVCSENQIIAPVLQQIPQVLGEEIHRA